ncbi:unnamed protein product [Cylicocyclus nassatus]|uniref:Tartrate-resistant acid phosphatase type 5 n=1 Tax=Cylicocyclus nassatus TaxID=53992 RepID=A0AA36GHF0_CYLNA|nr:unnamed protein product [Cylicocyclus nassatus]
MKDNMVMYQSLIVVVMVDLVGLAIIGFITRSPISSTFEKTADAIVETFFMTKERNAGPSSLELIVVGDIGGLPFYPYYTRAQRKVAQTMAKWAKEHNLHGVINAGDNMYFTGVDNEYSFRFRRTFEEIYDDMALNVTWFTIAGNHDHFGNISAQIAYTNHSQKWYFPSLYYNMSYKLGNTTVDVLMIDTIQLCGNTANVKNARIWDILRQHPPLGPENKTLADQQWAWIDRTMQASTADYLFVVGHYPIYSVSSHGPTKCLVDNLNPLLKEYHASAYFSGHDHNLQHFTSKSNTGQDIHYVVSGAGSRSDYSDSHRNKNYGAAFRYRYPSSRFISNPFSQLGFSDGGFVYMSLTKAYANLTFITGADVQKYRLFIYPRNLTWLRKPR